jgi:hypothetical protein
MDAMGVGDALSNDNVSSHVAAEKLPNPEATNFYKLLKAMVEPLWDRCTKQSKAMVQPYYSIVLTIFN